MGCSTTPIDLLPILVRVVKTSDIYDQIPDRHQYSKSWIIQVEDEQPITAQGLKDALYFLQRSTPRTISITFCKVEDAVRFPHHRHFEPILTRVQPSSSRT